MVVAAECSLHVSCWNAYMGEPPNAVEPIRAVSDFTNWLVVVARLMSQGWLGVCLTSTDLTGLRSLQPLGVSLAAGALRQAIQELDSR